MRILLRVSEDTAVRGRRHSLLLRLHAPKTYLAVVEGNLVCRDLIGFCNGSYGLASCNFSGEGAIYGRCSIVRSGEGCRGRRGAVRHGS